MTIHNRTTTRYRGVYTTTWSRNEFEAGKRKSADLFGPTASTPEAAREELYHHTEGNVHVPDRIEVQTSVVLETSWEKYCRELHSTTVTCKDCR